MGERVSTYSDGGCQIRINCMDVRYDGMLTTVSRTALKANTCIIQIPAGIFLPTIAIGACLGRAVGLLVYAFCTFI